MTETLDTGNTAANGQVTPLAHPSSCHDHTNKHFTAELLIRKTLSKKIEHNFSAVGLEKI